MHVTLKLHEHKARKRKDPWEMIFPKESLNIASTLQNKTKTRR